MITTVRLVNTSSPHIILSVCVQITVKMYFLNNFQAYKAVLLIIATVLCIRSLDHIYLTAGTLYPLTDISPFPLPPAPGNHHSSLYVYEFSFFRFCM